MLLPPNSPFAAKSQKKKVQSAPLLPFHIEGRHKEEARKAGNQYLRKLAKN